MKIVDVVNFLSQIEDVKYQSNIYQCMRDMQEIVDECIKDEDVRLNLIMVLDDVWLDNCIEKDRVFEVVKLYCEENEEQDLDITVLVNKIKNINYNEDIFYIDRVSNIIYSFTKELFEKIRTQIIHRLENYIRYETDLIEGDEF